MKFVRAKIAQSPVSSTPSIPSDRLWIRWDEHSQTHLPLLEDLSDDGRTSSLSNSSRRRGLSQIEEVDTDPEDHIQDAMRECEPTDDDTASEDLPLEETLSTYRGIGAEGWRKESVATVYEDCLPVESFKEPEAVLLKSNSYPTLESVLNRFETEDGKKQTLAGSVNGASRRQSKEIKAYSAPSTPTTEECTTQQLTTDVCSGRLTSPVCQNKLLEDVFSPRDKRSDKDRKGSVIEPTITRMVVHLYKPEIGVPTTPSTTNDHHKKLSAALKVIRSKNGRNDAAYGESSLDSDETLEERDIRPQTYDSADLIRYLPFGHVDSRLDSWSWAEEVQLTTDIDSPPALATKAPPNSKAQSPCTVERRGRDVPQHFPGLGLSASSFLSLNTESKKRQESSNSSRADMHFSHHKDSLALAHHRLLHDAIAGDLAATAGSEMEQDRHRDKGKHVHIAQSLPKTDADTSCCSETTQQYTPSTKRRALERSDETRFLVLGPTMHGRARAGIGR